MAAIFRPGIGPRVAFQCPEWPPAHAVIHRRLWIVDHAAWKRMRMGNTFRRALRHLEPLREGVAVVDEDRVDAVLARPARDRGHDGVVVADPGRRLDPAVEQRADDALVHEVVADLELALAGELGHPRRGAGAAGGPVDRLVTVEDGVAGMGAGIAGLAGPHDVAHAADRLVLGM